MNAFNIHCMKSIQYGAFSSLVHVLGCTFIFICTGDTLQINYCIYFFHLYLPLCTYSAKLQKIFLHRKCTICRLPFFYVLCVCRLAPFYLQCCQIFFAPKVLHLRLCTKGAKQHDIFAQQIERRSVTVWSKYISLYTFGVLQRVPDSAVSLSFTMHPGYRRLA